MSLKWLLLGGGIAALLFKDQILSYFEGPAAPTPATTDTAAASTTPAPAALDTSSAKARLLAAVQKDATYIGNGGTLSLYQWAFYYRLVRGVDPPTAETLGFANSDMLVTLDEYWAAITRQGLGRLAGRIRGGN